MTMDQTGEGSIRESNTKSAVALVDSRSKDVDKIFKSFKKHGLASKEGDYNFSKLVLHLKKEGFIEETKDAYILTKKGKEQAEIFKPRPDEDFRFI